MNEIKIIRRYFDFLLAEGFDCSVSKSNLEHVVSYTRGTLEIALTFDIREDWIKVNKVDKSDGLPLLERYLHFGIGE